MCDAHKWRARNGKDMDAPVSRTVPRGATLSERLYARLTPRHPGECWEWEGHRRPDKSKTGKSVVGGYGRMSVGGGKTQYAHIVSYEVHFGPVPEGREVRHMCNNPPCCNPLHLTSGTREENVRDMVESGTHYSFWRDGRL